METFKKLQVWAKSDNGQEILASIAGIFIALFLAVGMIGFDKI